jgi:hypothetical protein
VLPGITPDNIGTVRPADLLNALDLFDAKYRSGD